MSQCIPPWVNPIWDSLHFLDLSVSFSMLGKFSLFSLQIFSQAFSLSSSSDSYAADVGAFVAVPEVSLEKAMAPHSSTLARKIPWTGEPGGLPSRVAQSRTRLK